MKLLLAFVLSQTVAVSPPPSTLTLPHGALYVTATTQPPDVLIPGPPSPLHPPLPSHLPHTPWFDGHARAVLIVWVPGGYRITVARANGAHVTRTFSDQTTDVTVELK